MSRPKLSPHVFIPGPPGEADVNGRTACRTCHVVGTPDDPRHRMPDLFDADAESRRRTGEKED